MEAFLTSLLTDADGLVAYAAIFGILVACGLGLPLPEDISLITGGFLAYEGAVRLPAMMVVGFLGILVGDSLIYLAGRRVGSKVGRQGGFFARIVTPKKRARVEQLFAVHGQKIVMIARFLPGVRAVTYFTAGSAGMGYVRFILWDGLAALVSAPVFVFLGYHFGGELKQLIDALKRGQVKVVLALLLLVGGYLTYGWLKSRSLRRGLAPQVAVDAASAGAPLSSPPSPSEGSQGPTHVARTAAFDSEAVRAGATTK